MHLHPPSAENWIKDLSKRFPNLSNLTIHSLSPIKKKTILPSLEILGNSISSLTLHPLGEEFTEEIVNACTALSSLNLTFDYAIRKNIPYSKAYSRSVGIKTWATVGTLVSSPKLIDLVMPSLNVMRQIDLSATLINDKDISVILNLTNNLTSLFLNFCTSLNYTELYKKISSCPSHKILAHLQLCTRYINYLSKNKLPNLSLLAERLHSLQSLVIVGSVDSMISQSLISFRKCEWLNYFEFTSRESVEQQAIRALPRTKIKRNEAKI